MSNLPSDSLSPMASEVALRTASPVPPGGIFYIRTEIVTSPSAINSNKDVRLSSDQPASHTLGNLDGNEARQFQPHSGKMSSSRAIPLPGGLFHANTHGRTPPSSLHTVARSHRYTRARFNPEILEAEGYARQGTLATPTYAPLVCIRATSSALKLRIAVSALPLETASDGPGSRMPRAYRVEKSTFCLIRPLAIVRERRFF